MTWHAYAFPVLSSTLVVILSFLIGKFNYSVLWILLIIGLSVARSHFWKQRQRKIAALQAASMMEKEVVEAVLGSHFEKMMPAWVSFPDVERAEWINKLVLQLWPYLSEFMKLFIREQIEPQVKQNLPALFRSFCFEEMNMGDIPVRLSGIKVYTDTVGRDRAIMDMDIAYAGDCSFVVAVGGFKAGMNNLQFRGKMRWVLKPLVSQMPMVGGVSLFFLDKPELDFNLTGLGEIAELPGLFSAVKLVIVDQLSRLCVIPNEIVVPLIPGVDPVKLRFPEPDGVVRIHVVQGRDLQNMDMSIGILKKGKSDPYVRLSVGGQLFKSKTIDNNLNPVWNEFFQAVVDHASGQQVLVECYDEDPGCHDEFMGRASVNLSAVRSRGHIDAWYPLEGAKQGDIQLKLYWMNLSANPRDLDQSKWDAEWSKSKKVLDVALLTVYIDGVKNLLGSRVDQEPSPYIELCVVENAYVQRTYTRFKTTNPVYQQKFLFFVSNVEAQKLKLTAKQDSTDRVLSELAIPISGLLNEPNMELYQRTFHMAAGARLSPIVLTLRLRILDFSGTIPVNETEAVDNFQSLIGQLLKPDTEVTASKAADVFTAQGKKRDSMATLKRMPEISLNGSADGVFGGVSAGTPPSRKKLSNASRLTENGELRSRSGSPAGLLRRRSMKLKFIQHSGSELVIGKLGRIELSVELHSHEHKISVFLHGAEGLIPFNDAGIANPYCSLVLFCAGKRRAKRRSKTISETLSPVWDERFEFEFSSGSGFTAEQLTQFSIRVAVKDAINYHGAVHFGAKKSPVHGQIVYKFGALVSSKAAMKHCFLLGPDGYEGAEEYCP